MHWFDEAAARPTQQQPEHPRSRRVLVAGLVALGALLGLLIAGATSVVAHYADNENAAGPPAPATPRPTPALAGLACGDPAPLADTDPERTLVAVVEVLDAYETGGRYGAGAQLPVTVALVNFGAELELRAESDIAVVAVRDGVVVGIPVTVPLRHDDERRRDAYRLTVPSGIGLSAELTYPLTACGGGTLEPGDYTLVGGLRVAEIGGGGRELVGASPSVA